jgi:SAM-dependent methyltransferase
VCDDELIRLRMGEAMPPREPGDMEVTLDFTAWLARWDDQQAGYQTDREERFQVMFDALEAITGGGSLSAIDLACGPGSLAVRLLDRFPGARVAAVDVDPVLLALGRGAFDCKAGLTFVEADLRGPDWPAALPAGPFDAVLSTTALHWLAAEDIRRLYRDLARLLRPGGAFLDGDHRRFGPERERLAATARTMTELARVRRHSSSAPPENWDAWWNAVRAEPALADAVAARDRLGHAHPHRGRELSDEDHCGLLLAAGFAEAGTLWQHGDDRILAAIR